MKNFDYVSGVYRTALLIHPFLFVLQFSIREGLFDASLLLFSGLFGILFSVPAFFLCLLTFQYIIPNIPQRSAKFIFWITLTIIGVVLSYLLIANLFLGFALSLSFFSICFPGCTAALFAIIIKRKSFYLLISNSTKNNNDENSLV